LILRPFPSQQEKATCLYYATNVIVINVVVIIAIGTINGTDGVLINRLSNSGIFGQILSDDCYDHDEWFWRDRFKGGCVSVEYHPRG
jgi:hypothetical protein